MTGDKLSSKSSRVEQGHKGLEALIPWSTLASLVLAIVIAITIPLYSETWDDPVLTTTTLVLTAVIGGIGIFIDLVRKFMQNIRSHITNEVERSRDATASNIGASEKRLEDRLGQIGSDLRYYSDIVVDFPANEALRARMIQMIQAHIALHAIGRVELSNVSEEVIARHSTELRNTGGAIELLVPQKGTYPIYRAILGSRSPVDEMLTVNCIDLDWWVNGEEPNRYIELNRQMLLDGRVKSIRRLFIVRRGEWGEGSKGLLDQIKNVITSGVCVHSIRLFAVFDDDLLRAGLKLLDVIIRLEDLAIEWDPKSDQSYPLLRIYTDQRSVSDLKDRVEVIFRNRAVRPIDAFLTEA